MAQTVDEIVWTVAKHAVGKLNYLDCIVYLLDEEEKHLIQRAAHGPKNPIDFDIDNPIRLKIGEGICGSVAQSGIAEIIADTSKDPRYKVDDDQRFSEITVPIISHGKVIGIIDSEHPDKNHYTEEDLRILTTIASMTSTKLDQAWSQEKLEKYSDQLEVLVNEKTIELQKHINELEEANDRIRRSNEEKEVLLKEIHHRVKNNLQVISSLLNLQAHSLEDDQARNVFHDCRNRIISMAAIHEQLYVEKDLSKIDAEKYFKDICDSLIKSFEKEHLLEIEHEVESIGLSIDEAVPVGLILNELVVNAIKHAFEGNESGRIVVSLKEKDGLAVLTVSDNGVGIDKSKQSQSLGLELVETLTDQIDGKIEIDGSNEGTVAKLSF